MTAFCILSCAPHYFRTWIALCSSRMTPLRVMWALHVRQGAVMTAKPRGRGETRSHLLKSIYHGVWAWRFIIWSDEIPDKTIFNCQHSHSAPASNRQQHSSQRSDEGEAQKFPCTTPFIERVGNNLNFIPRAAVVSTIFYYSLLKRLYGTANSFIALCKLELKRGSLREFCSAVRWIYVGTIAELACWWSRIGMKNSSMQNWA